MSCAGACTNASATSLAARAPGIQLEDRGTHVRGLVLLVTVTAVAAVAVALPVLCLRWPVLLLLLDVRAASSLQGTG